MAHAAHLLSTVVHCCPLRLGMFYHIKYRIIVCAYGFTALLLFGFRKTKSRVCVCNGVAIPDDPAPVLCGDMRGAIERAVGLVHIQACMHGHAHIEACTHRHAQAQANQRKY